MRDAFIDVSIEVPARALMLDRNPSQAVMERLEAAALAKCDQNLGRLRTDKGPEVIVKAAVEISTGVDMVLVAARWPVVIPDAVAP